MPTKVCPRLNRELGIEWPAIRRECREAHGGNRSPLPVRHQRTIRLTALDTEAHVPLPVPSGNAHEGNVMNQRQSSLLVVDDDPHILATLPRLLAGEFEVLTAASADDAQR